MYCHIRDFKEFEEVDPCNQKKTEPYPALLKKMMDFIAPPRASPTKDRSASSQVEDTQRQEEEGSQSPSSAHEGTPWARVPAPDAKDAN